MTSAIRLRAHYDGEKIILDEPFELEPETELIVTIVQPGGLGEEHDDWLRLSMSGLARAYGDDEPEYTMDMIKEPNPDYDGR
jgi:hypothetical protein